MVFFVECFSVRRENVSNVSETFDVIGWSNALAFDARHSTDTVSRIYLFRFKGRNQNTNKSGDNSREDTPVPISNTEVKLLSADDTWREAAWESRTLPVFLLPERQI